MPKTIIADTSCFIILDNIGMVSILKDLYGQVVTTTDVATEFGQPLPDWVEIKSPVNKAMQSVIEMQVDKGEASAITLAVETPGSTVILDDYKARKVAEKLELAVTGTLGVIVKAKQKGIIASIKPLIEKMASMGFYLSNELLQEALKNAGEK